MHFLVCGKNKESGRHNIFPYVPLTIIIEKNIKKA